MEIKKKLNLNRTPYNSLNYSMCFAKNIKLSEDSTSIITDNGVSLALPTGDLQIDGNIVGIIPCSNELVILTDSNKIYRGKEQFDTNILDLIECETAWTYSGGTINGAYTYNVKNELIISIAEYKDDILIPLKTINLDTATAEDIDSKYEVCPPMPITNMKQIQIVKGKLIPTGIYYFFCRYEIDDEYYTDWMPIGIPYYAINMENKSLINLDLFTDFGDFGKLIVRCNYNGNINNIKNDSPYNPKLKITTNNYYNYKNIQIGYILQHENATVCRSWKKFKCDNIIDFIFDTSDFEEYSITDMLSTPFNIYNVKNICNYENRLYIANYNETDFNAPKTDNRLIQAAAKIKAYQIFEDVKDEFVFETGSSSDNYNSIFTFKTLLGDFEYVGEQNTDFIKLSSFSGLTEALYNNRNGSSNSFMRIIKPVTQGSNIEDEIRQYGFRVWFTNLPDEDDLMYDYLNEIELNCTDNSRRNPYFAVSDPNNNITKYASLRRTYQIENYYPIYYDTYQGQQAYYYYGADNRTGKPNQLVLADKDPSLYDRGIATLDDYEYFYLIDLSTCSISKIKKLDTLVDNSIRTLMPNDVYAFYIHYIRKDGTYTNGIPLENIDAVDKYNNIYVQDKSTFVYNELLETNENLKHFEIGYYPVDENTNEAPFNYYENIEGKKLFATSNGYRSETIEDTINHETLEVIKNKIIIKVKFTNIDIPDGYCGCFFSYEKPAELVKYHGYITSQKNDESSAFNVRIKATEVECGKVNYNGDILMPYGYYKCVNWNDPNTANQDYARKVVENMGYIVDSKILMSNSPSECNFDENDNTGTYGCEGCIQMHVINNENTTSAESDTYFKVPKGGCECYIKSINRNIYTNTNKELISFGGILEIIGDERTNLEYSESTTNSNFKYPIFYTTDKMIIYKSKVELDDATLYPYPITNNTIDKTALIHIDHDGAYFIVKITPYRSPTYEYLYTAYVKSNDSSGGNGRFWYAYYRTVNKYSKYNLNSIYFKNPPTKVAIAFDKHIRINNTVYPKDLTDLFDIHNDYIEKEYKSYINYNDYTTTDTLKLSTIRRSDVIADESTENAWRHFRANAYKIINRNKGDITNIVGLGLYLVIHTTQTLFILDKTALLKTETRTVGIESPDTFDCEPTELFVTQHGYGGLQNVDGWCVNHIGYFFIDRDNNRIFLLKDNQINDLTADIIKYIDHYKIKDCKLVTDFKNNRVLISIIHQNDNVTTLSYNYVVNSFISIHDFKFEKGYSTKNRTYLQGNDLTNIYVIDKSVYADYKELYYTNPNLPNYNEENLTTSVIDIIVNAIQDTTKAFYERIPLDYDYTKELDSITYSVNKIHAFEDNDYMADEFLDTQRENDITHYSGDKLKIYTNITDSGLLDITQPEEVNKIEEYKIPHFDKGNWNLNYFRNKINTPVEESKDFSDNKSLIYGKYFVCRFIFNITNNIPIRFETLSVNSKTY